MHAAPAAPVMAAPPRSEVLVDEDCPLTRPLYECIMAARSRLPGMAGPVNASAGRGGAAPAPDHHGARNKALLIALPIAIGVPACE